MKRILIYGVGSYKNRGVEAIINTLLSQITEDVKIDVASYDIENNKKYYNDKINKYINHRNNYETLPLKTRLLINEYAKNNNYYEIECIYQKDVIKNIKNYDICISAGGDNYCYNANDWLFTIDQTVKKYNKKLVLFGASLYEKIENERLIEDMDLFDVLCIRESISYKEIEKYINPKKIIYEPDTAFSLKTEKIELDDWYKNRKVVGINISPTVIGMENIHNRINSIIDLINHILVNTDYSISLISHVTIDESNDYNICKLIYDIFEKEDRVFLEDINYNCSQVKYIISKCELMIAARTHASIAAYSSYVPTLVLGYSVKSKGIATDIFGTDKNYVIPYDQLNSSYLIDKFDWLNKNKKAIKERLSLVIPDMIESSKHVFSKVMKKINSQSKKEICNPKDCINCNLCINTCKVDAIKTIKTDINFTYNERDTKKCVECNKCIDICPANSLFDKEKYNIKCYAAKNKNEEIQKQSASGGVFSTIAEYILKQKGVVYGAERKDNITKHIRITNKNDLSKIRGSKYSYSSLDNIYKSIIKDCNNNTKILFSGTPCQVSAIKKLLGNYKKIIYVSVICHGVLNDKLVNEYCNSKDIKLIEYRTKENGWSISSVKYDKYINRFMDDQLMALYVNNVLLRDSCYNCRFRLDNNQSDIILGDYWGIKEINKDLYDDNGVSAVIINSIKGEELFEKIKDKISFKKTNISDLEKYNPSLYKSPEKPKERVIIDKLLKENSWDLIYQLSIQKNKINELKRTIDELDKNIEDKEQEIIDIKSSKRWKLIDNMMNKTNKIIRRR